MLTFSGKTAFVTGGASGIGLALCRRFAADGMNVVVADVEETALHEAVAGLREAGGRIEEIVLDVADRAAYERAAAAALSSFGPVHVLCNNAGVSRAGPIESVSPADWNWVIDVNLKGLINGLQVFLPSMKAHGERGHIVNTASLAGLAGNALSGPYVATKFAIVGLSQVLADELSDGPLSVSVLCPAWVKTQMLDNGRNRPERFGGAFTLAGDVANAERNARYAEALRHGREPDDVADMVAEAIRERRFYILTDDKPRSDLVRRFDHILEGFDALTRRSEKAAPNLPDRESA